MAWKGTWKRTLWPVAVLLCATSLLGLECQLEPLPDERRGFLGDLCYQDGDCERRVSTDGGMTLDLICAPDPGGGSRCRQRCTLGDESLCGTCGPEARCAAITSDDGTIPPGTGACVPAAAEGEPCGTALCAGCLLCARESANATPTCRRQCEPSIDAGPGNVAITGAHPWCRYADRKETGAVVLQNCCLYGQRCTQVDSQETTEQVCFGPIPTEPGGTCDSLDECATNAVCIAGDQEGPNDTEFVPDVCFAAGGENQPCRDNATCNPGLTCICEAAGGCRDRTNPTLPPPICRKNCSTSQSACADGCNEGFDCAQVRDAPQGNGVCVPAATEGNTCAGAGCSRCLVCAGFEGSDAGQACRRPCDLNVDQGMPDAAVLKGPGDTCLEPDPDPASGIVIMKNCCPLGQRCLPFTSSGGAGCFD